MVFLTCQQADKIFITATRVMLIFVCKFTQCYQMTFILLAFEGGTYSGSRGLTRDLFIFLALRKETNSEKSTFLSCTHIFIRTSIIGP